MMLDNTKSIEEILLDEGVITYKVIGKSMEPMIRQNQDLVTIAKKNPKVSCFENDVVLFKKGGNLVLHRIVDVLPDKLYNILGDNCAKIERNIKEEDIIGVMSHFYRNGIRYSVFDSVYINYVNRLRDNEKARMHRKYLYDIIVWCFRFLPDRYLVIIKNLARKITNCQMKFE